MQDLALSAFLNCLWGLSLVFNSIVSRLRLWPTSCQMSVFQLCTGQPLTSSLWNKQPASRSASLCTKLQRIAAAAAAAKSLQSYPTLRDPIDGSPPGSPVPGILQARTLEWVAISFSNAWKWKVKVKSLSRDQLLATPWTAAYQAALSMGFSRQEYWSGVPLPSPQLTRGAIISGKCPGDWQQRGTCSLRLSPLRVERHSHTLPAPLEIYMLKHQYDTSVPLTF